MSNYLSSPHSFSTLLFNTVWLGDSFQNLNLPVPFCLLQSLCWLLIAQRLKTKLSNWEEEALWCRSAPPASPTLCSPPLCAWHFTGGEMVLRKRFSPCPQDTYGLMRAITLHDMDSITVE